MDCIQLYQGDITQLTVDAIVNAANSSLLGGGGVDGAIHHAAGPKLLSECRGLNGCPAGEARITDAYRLPAKKIIHTVGPIWQGGTANEEHLLACAYTSSLILAEQYHLHTVAFPNISTGVYGFPKDRAAHIALQTVSEFMKTHDSVSTVIFCIFNSVNYTIYKKLLTKMGIATKL